MKRLLLNEYMATGCSYSLLSLSLSLFPSVPDQEGAKRPSAVRPLLEIAQRDRDERVGRDERTPMISEFKVFSQLVTSQVTSMTENDHMFFANNS